MRGYGGCKPPEIRCGKQLLQTHKYSIPPLAKHNAPHTAGYYKLSYYIKYFVTSH